LKNEFNKNEFKKTIISLLSLLKNYKIAIIIIFIFTILSSIFSIISPKILGEAINLIKDGINNSNAINLSKLLNIILTLLILYIISFIFNYFQNYKLAKISANISYNLRKEIIKKINKIPLSFFNCFLFSMNFEMNSNSFKLSLISSCVISLGLLLKINTSFHLFYIST